MPLVISHDVTSRQSFVTAAVLRTCRTVWASAANSETLRSTCTDHIVLSQHRMLDHRRLRENGRDIDVWWLSLWLLLLAFVAL